MKKNISILLFCVLLFSFAGFVNAKVDSTGQGIITLYQNKQNDIKDAYFNRLQSYIIRYIDRLLNQAENLLEKENISEELKEDIEENIQDLTELKETAETTEDLDELKDIYRDLRKYYQRTWQFQKRIATQNFFARYKDRILNKIQNRIDSLRDRGGDEELLDDAQASLDELKEELEDDEVNNVKTFIREINEKAKEIWRDLQEIARDIIDDTDDDEEETEEEEEE